MDDVEIDNNNNNITKHTIKIKRIRSPGSEHVMQQESDERKKKQKIKKAAQNATTSTTQPKPSQTIKLTPNNNATRKK